MKASKTVVCKKCAQCSGTFASDYTMPTLDSWIVKSWLSTGLFVIAYDPANLPPLQPKDNNHNANVVRERDLNFIVDHVARRIGEQDPLVAQVGTVYVLAGVRNSANSMMIMSA